MPEKTKRPIAIVAALPIELNGARRALRSQKELLLGPLRAWVGTADAPGEPPRAVIVAAIGLGRTAVEGSLERLVAELSPSAIALVGISGGCAVDATPGSAWLCDPLLVEPEIGADCAPIASDPGLGEAIRRAAARAGIPLRTGPSVTIGVYADPRAKESLGHTRGATVCEMENYFAARFCAVRGVPFAALRVTFDGVTDALPHIPGLGAEPLLRVLARRPDALLALPRLAWRMMRARRVLDPLARALVGELAASAP